MAEIVIIPLQTFSGFATNGNAAMEASTPLIAGKRYRLSWDGVEYLYDAIDFSQIYGPGATAVVDVTADDPFGVVYVPGIDGNPDQYIFGPTMADLDAGIDSHTVGLWLVEEGSGGNDHPDETVILPAGAKTFSPGVNGLGEPIYTTTFLEFELVRWRKYRVRWEGEETVLMAYPGPNGEVCLGNLFITGAGENTGERFLIVYGEGYSNIATYEAGESREVAIWLTNEVGVVLQDYAGGERAYFDVERLAVPSTDGNIREYVHSSLIPEAVEKTLELNFENGPMEVLPELGKVFSKLLIPVPDGLASANIADGVTVAGIPGSHKGGGGSGSYKFFSGSFDATSKIQTVTHNCGVVPDILIGYLGGIPSNGVAFFCVAFSQKFYNGAGGGYLSQVVFVMSSGGSLSSGSDIGMDNPITGYYADYGGIRNVDEKTFTFGGSTYGLKIGEFYQWVAVCLP